MARAASKYPQRASAVSPETVVQLAGPHSAPTEAVQAAAQRREHREDADEAALTAAGEVAAGGEDMESIGEEAMDVGLTHVDVVGREKEGNRGATVAGKAAGEGLECRVEHSSFPRYV